MDGEEKQLPLTLLRDRVSSNTFSWLEKADIEEAKKEAELDDDEAAIATALFGQLMNANEDKDDEDDGSVYERVQEWSSSTTNPDGIGGTNVYDDEEYKFDAIQNDAISVKYILSEASGGHGDDLWAAARHIANIFADPEKCGQLLGPLLLSSEMEERDNKHPLLGLKFVELGAGAGVPSWVAMKCGATVICTDQGIPNRIRCIAECAERNLQDMRINCAENDDQQKALFFAEKSRACPYDWGSVIDEVVEAFHQDNQSEGNRNVLADIVIAADCIYMPQFHSQLLDSIKMLMAKTGVALLPFALHGNTKDDNVWSIVDLAKKKEFMVEILESKQLTPQGAFMDNKRALVNMIRLTHI